MVKTPKCSASFSCGQEAISILDCRVATCREAASCCSARSANTTHNSLLLFWLPTNTSSLGAMGAPWGPEGGDTPNKLRSNFLKIRLDVGWIILPDLLIWQFVLTHCVQCGPACYWVMFCLMPVEQFNLHNPVDWTDLTCVLFAEGMKGI